MNTKNLMVSFCTIAIALFLVGFISAADPLVTVDSIEINGIEESSNDISVIAGDTLTVTVFFTALEDASNVRMEAEVEGSRVDVN